MALITDINAKGLGFTTDLGRKSARFAILSIDSEGLEVAKFLAAKGITAIDAPSSATGNCIETAGKSNLFRPLVEAHG